jgi:hypothetical protein
MDLLIILHNGLSVLVLERDYLLLHLFIQKSYYLGGQQGSIGGFQNHSRRNPGWHAQ